MLAKCFGIMCVFAAGVMTVGAGMNIASNLAGKSVLATLVALCYLAIGVALIFKEKK
jgi:hypothetical protein